MRLTKGFYWPLFRSGTGELLAKTSLPKKSCRESQPTSTRKPSNFSTFFLKHLTSASEDPWFFNLVKKNFRQMFLTSRSLLNPDTCSTTDSHNDTNSPRGTKSQNKTTLKKIFTRHSSWEEIHYDNNEDNDND